MRIFFDASPIFIPKIANTRSKRAKKGNSTPLSHTQFPKSHCRGSRHIQRIDLMRHRDAHHIIAIGNGLARQAIALGSHHYCEALNPAQQRIVERDGIVGKRHGSHLKPKVAKRSYRHIEPSPKHWVKRKVFVYVHWPTVEQIF